MELKATPLGKRLAQHPYDRAEILAAGVKVSGEQHEYLIPFNQLLAIHCKRGLVWGEMEFVLADNQTVRLHGTEWQETQQFWRHLSTLWDQWSQKMSEIAAGLLHNQSTQIQRRIQQKTWMTSQDVTGLQQEIKNTVNALPLPVARLPEFASCYANWQQCQLWLEHGDSCRLQHNQTWTDHVHQQYKDFFTNFTSAPLDPSQLCALINDEDSVLVQGGPGSGKSTILLARAGWLLLRGCATTEQILLLTLSPEAMQQLNQDLSQDLPPDNLRTNTFHALALQIIQQSSNKKPIISQYEQDIQKRYALWIACWRQQCSEKKSHAKAWRQWLQQLLDCFPDEVSFWQNEQLASRLAPRLDHWLQLIKMHGGGQKHLPASVPEALRGSFEKHLPLLMPLLKAWKTTLKSEGALDFSALMQQACSLLDNGRFVSPWKYILLDDFQNMSPQHIALLLAFRRQNPRTTIFATGDDGQTISEFSGSPTNLSDKFHQYFGNADHCLLDTSYRLNQRINEISSQFIRQNPQQSRKSLNSLIPGDKKALTLLPEHQLAALLDKLSGYVKPQQRVLLLARYAYLRPLLLDCAPTRWPELTLDFMTIALAQGQQADYCIIVGLDNTADGLPSGIAEPVIERALSPAADLFPYACQRRLLYVALTRARHRVWLLFDQQHPSPFIEELKQSAVPLAKKP